jgi:hypothetical protein
VADDLVHAEGGGHSHRSCSGTVLGIVVGKLGADKYMGLPVFIKTINIDRHYQEG